ncbi:hypothetical protein FG379_003362 [Cryptosporidium bovis]|uniref:uncharacterized protein n=1 Tax=Cryptosporidium bovis TaxID=310047 RepID=UPI00351A8726|nr:hypothetical protein FG379_003362 [Cryptosporidium bovis]
MNDDNEKIVQKNLIKIGNGKINDELKERLIRATKINNQFEVKVNKKIVLNQEEYYEKLNNIIRDDYYPDLNYLNKNKDNHEVIKRSIHDLPGTLSQNELICDDNAGIDLDRGNYNGKLPFNNNEKMNISEFQSNYTNDNYISFLELENRDQIKKRSKLYWIEEQSIRHNLNREINLINSEMKTLTNDITNIRDSTNYKDDSSLILQKNEPRTTFMFGTNKTDAINYNLNTKNSNCNNNNSKMASEKINPSNTRYNSDGRELLPLNRDRLLFLKKIRRKQENSELKDETRLLLKSPLIKNAINKSKGDLRYIDYELRNSYSSYKGKKSNTSFSRLTKL